jgi:hypothetical protein
MVHIPRLTAALRQTLWRQGFIKPEALRHTRDERGDHVFSVVIPQGDCEFEIPRSAPTELRTLLGPATVALKPREER